MTKETNCCFNVKLTFVYLTLVSGVVEVKRAKSATFIIRTNGFKRKIALVL